MRNNFLSTRHASKSPVVISILAAVLLSGCAHFGELSTGSEDIAAISISADSSGKIVPGQFVWHDLLTPDIKTAGEFYKNLFDWQIECQDHYALVRNNGKMIATLLKTEPAAKKTSGTWIPSVSVQDVDAATRLVKEEGGTVLRGPADMGKRGRAALIRDFQGADLVLLRIPGGDPSQEEVSMGDWLWDEIWSSAPDKTAIFYTSVFGYAEVQSVKEDYGVFMLEGKPQAGLRHLGIVAPPPRWVPVVRVADPEETCRKAEELGGVVRVKPEDAPNVGDTALISDPTGALLLVQRWPQPADGGI